MSEKYIIIVYISVFVIKVFDGEGAASPALLNIGGRTK